LDEREWGSSVEPIAWAVDPVDGMITGGLGIVREVKFAWFKGCGVGVLRETAS
jgi:hypothetical protein